MPVTDPFDQLWKITWWSVQSDEGKGLPATGFADGAQILVGAETEAKERSLQWKDAKGKNCQMRLTVRGNQLEGKGVEVSFGGQSYSCGLVQVSALGSADGSVQMLVGFLFETLPFSIGTGNAGAFIAQAGPVTPRQPKRVRSAKPKR